MATTIVSVFQAALGRPLDRAELSNHPLRASELERLRPAIEDHYRTHVVPDKDRFELRPSISVGYEASLSTGLHYVFGAKHYRGTHQYTFDPATQGLMLDSIKTFLLYCHSLVVQDPLPYLLDYFTGGHGGEVALRRLPAVNSLLGEYADLGGLIEDGVLIPVSESVIPILDVPELTGHLRNELESALPLEPNVAAMAREILEEQFRCRRFNDQVDLFLPKPEYVPVLNELLKLTERRFERDRVVEPFALAFLGNLRTLIPGAVSVADLVKMRSDDKAFDEWRSFLGSIFRDIQSHELSHLALDDEFMRSARREFAARRESFTGRIRAGSMKTSLIKSGRDIGIGLLAGAGTWGATGSSSASLIAASAAGGIKPLIELLANVATAGARQKGAMSFRRHFMAIGFDDGELPR